MLLGSMESDMTCGTQAAQVLLEQRYKDMARRNIRPLPTFDEAGFRCCSQFEEDGILLYIFSLIGVTNKTAVEICAGDGIQCNSANLIINHGWHGYLFDGDRKNVVRGSQYYRRHKDTFLWPPKLTHAWITAENVDRTLQDAGVEGEVDLLSVDVDGMDYWIWKAINCINPRVVVCETHNVIPADKALTVPYDRSFKISVEDYHGASLAAMTKLAKEKGYRLAGTHRYGFNAFFIRNGVGEELLPAVGVQDCLLHPYAKHRSRDAWPKVGNLPWEQV